jgi:crotonobetainyl-CoA:carnitine CoA-transferase CaiB-like acyl-CoA transferase
MRLPMSVLLATGTTPTRVGNDHLNIAPYQPLRAKDGLIIVAVANPALWIRFCEAMERPEWRDDPRFKTNTERVANRVVLKDAIERVFAGFTVEELTARFQAKNVPCGRVRSISEALEHPQVGPREILLAQDHAQIGKVETLAPVVRLSRTPADVTLPPPALGEHTQEILEGLRAKG